MQKWIRIFLICITAVLLYSTAFASQIQGIVELLSVLPFDSSVFLQGLECIDENRLLVSGGLYNTSSIGIWNIKHNAWEKQLPLPPAYFAEGLTQTPYGIWQFTWQENTAFLRDSATLQSKKQVAFQGEGWGLAYVPESDVLISSDGSSSLIVRSAEDFTEIRRFDIGTQNINELEYAEGYLYANIWQSNRILKIDLQKQSVVKEYDMQPILESLDLTEQQRCQMDVLNGIAHIKGNLFYIGGKLYPVMMKVKLH